MIPKLLLILTMIESGHDTTAINHEEDAVGILQIRPIMVDEVNRIQEMAGVQERFTLEDRLNKTQSYRMCAIFLTYQIAKYRKYYQAEPHWTRIAGAWNTGSIFAEAPERYQDKLTIHQDIMKLPETD